MRLFLAIDFPLQVKNQLYCQLGLLQKEYPSFNWVREENYHMTVHFFGEARHVSQITKDTQELLYDQKPFYLYGTHLDLFMGQQITIYVNFHRERKLEELIEKVEKLFTPDTKKFIPHVTVARCRIPSKQQYFLLKKKVERTNINFEYQVKELTLFESIPSPKKPTYNKLASIPFPEDL